MKVEFEKARTALSFGDLDMGDLFSLVGDDQNIFMRVGNTPAPEDDEDIDDFGLNAISSYGAVFTFYGHEMVNLREGKLIIKD